MVLLALLASPALAVAALMLYVRSPLSTGVGEQVDQPIAFDHRHHVGDEGIDCRYCHDTVERSPTAGIPSVSTCMNCHAQVWNKSPALAAVRGAYFLDRPIRWNRVNDLPDFVFFNHSIHVNKGVGCATCHGRVDRMPLVEKVHAFSMKWCLDCHRDPSPHLRPREAITALDWAPPPDAEGFARQLTDRYEVQPRTNCTTCHR
jgi:hypothetical protein